MLNWSNIRAAFASWYILPNWAWIYLEQWIDGPHCLALLDLPAEPFIPLTFLCASTSSPSIEPQLSEGRETPLPFHGTFIWERFPRDHFKVAISAWSRTPSILENDQWCLKLCLYDASYLFIAYLLHIIQNTKASSQCPGRASRLSAVTVL